MTAHGSILYLDSVSVSFDGFKALNNLSLILQPGEMRAIIGPNGAGKTTMMDVITGKTRPDTGDVIFDSNHDLIQMDEAAIAQLGIGRKFQKPTVFEHHTVEDNLYLSLKGGRGVFFALFAEKTNEISQRIEGLFDIIRLGSVRDELAGNLSHGQKQWLEIGMLLAQDPKLLLVDAANLLREINKTHSVVVVEHDMTFVRDLDVKVTVLHEGSVLADGPLDQVSADERVIEVYLGR
jgi:urea transport system ATP-binding protein